MRRFIITGAPGAGKTAIIRQLELDGFSVVEEAATDIIAAAQAQGTLQPWTHPSFIDAIAKLQRDRQIRASYQPDEVQFHDRCAVCTAALAVYLGHPFSFFLAGELERVGKMLGVPGVENDTVLGGVSVEPVVLIVPRGLP